MENIRDPSEERLQTEKKNGLFLALLVLSVLSNFIIPVGTVVVPPFTYVGIILIGFGILMDLWPSLLFYRRKTTISPYGTPTSLVKEGPYRISRNPIYLGMTVLLLGIAIFLGSLVTFIFPAIFFLVAEATFIPREERSLENTFGEDYDNYRRNVRRWI